MSDVRLPDVTEIGFTMIVDGQKRVVTFLRPDKIKSLLDAYDESLAGFLCTIRDSDPTVADDVYDAPGDAAEHVEAEIREVHASQVDLGAVVRLDEELAAALPGMFERAGVVIPEPGSRNRPLCMMGAAIGLLRRYAHEIELSDEDLIQLVENWVLTKFTVQGRGDA